MAYRFGTVFIHAYTSLRGNDPEDSEHDVTLTRISKLTSQFSAEGLHGRKGN